MSFETASRVEGAGKACQDRVALFTSGRWVVAVVADGAGGTSGGAQAATAVVEGVRRAIEEGRKLGAGTLRQLLLEIGVELEAAGTGQSTAVVVVASGRRVVGASIGDSAAWLVGPSESRELTAGQPRKPLLGGGVAEPLTFTSDEGHGTLLLATDGVLKYVAGDTLESLVRRRDVTAHECCASIIDAARLPGGRLQDDAAVALVRLPLRDEAQLVGWLRTWRESLASGAPEDARVESERHFHWELEDWIDDLLPSGGPLEGGTDGLVLWHFREDEDGLIAINGSIWQLGRQSLYPFEVRLRIGADRVEQYEMLFGNAAEPGGGALSYFQPGDPRDWMFRVAGP